MTALERRLKKQQERKARKEYFVQNVINAEKHIIEEHCGNILGAALTISVDSDQELQDIIGQIISDQTGLIK